MAFVVRILLLEADGTENKSGIGGMVHADTHYEYSSLEMAREAAQRASMKAASMKPSRTKAVSDEDWTEYPDRSDADDVKPQTG